MSPEAGMDPAVFFAVLAAAAMHAGWNAILKIRLDPFLAIVVITVAGSLIAWPLVPIFGLPPLRAMPWVFASVALHLGYCIALTEAYARADLSQMYPIARGSAPLLTAIGSLVLLRESLAPAAIAGIALLGCGIALMALRGGRTAAHLDRPALGYALLTAATIAGYTLVDGVGARVSGDANAYAVTLFAFEGISITLFALWRRGAAELKKATPFIGPGLLGGAMSLASYWIAIWAMTVAPIALVAAVRETSVLFGAFIAVLVLKEPPTRPRILALLLTVAGLVAIRAQ